MELDSSFIYKIYLKDISDQFLSGLDISYYSDIGGLYIIGIYFSRFIFDGEEGILINNRNRRIFFSNKNIIQFVPIESI